MNRFIGSFFVVEFLMNLTQLLICDVSIDLSCGDGGMTKHGLNGTDIGAITQKVGGITVA